MQEIHCTNIEVLQTIPDLDRSTDSVVRTKKMVLGNMRDVVGLIHWMHQTTAGVVRSIFKMVPSKVWMLRTMAEMVRPKEWMHGSIVRTLWTGFDRSRVAKHALLHKREEGCHGEASEPSFPVIPAVQSPRRLAIENLDRNMQISTPQNSTPNSAREYDRKVLRDIPYYAQMQDEILHFARSLGRRFDVWLDTGCGTGVLARRVMDAGLCGKLILADPSREMLDVAREKVGEPVDSFCQKTQDLDLPNASCDVVTAIQAHHYGTRDDRLRALLRCYDLLKPGGILITSENVAPGSEGSVSVFLNYWKEFQVREGKTGEEAAHHISRYDQAYFPIPLREHFELSRTVGFRDAELLWKSYLQAVLVLRK